MPEERISQGPRHSFRGNEAGESKINHLHVPRDDIVKKVALSGDEWVKLLKKARAHQELLSQ
jgi:hypothetical protein